VEASPFIVLDNTSFFREYFKRTDVLARERRTKLNYVENGIQEFFGNTLCKDGWFNVLCPTNAVT